MNRPPGTRASTPHPARAATRWTGLERGKRPPWGTEARGPDQRSRARRYVSRPSTMPGMPIYTYVCNDCHERRDVRQSMTSEPLTECPDTECGGKLRKVITAPGISFKGSGFYRTDHVPAPPKKRKK